VNLADFTVSAAQGTPSGMSRMPGLYRHDIGTRHIVTGVTPTTIVITAESLNRGIIDVNRFKSNCP